MSLVKLGLYIMVFSLLSTAVTIPTESGQISGVGFVVGMVLTWIAGIGVIGKWTFRRWQAYRNR